MKPLLMMALLFGMVIAACGDVVKYAYDDAGRLARVDYPSGASILYTYDNAGNLLSRTVNKPSANEIRAARKDNPAAQPRRLKKSRIPKQSDREGVFDRAGAAPRSSVQMS
jgi:YD repeat-containing protein